MFQSNVNSNTSTVYIPISTYIKKRTLSSSVNMQITNILLVDTRYMNKFQKDNMKYYGYLYELL